MVSDISRNDNRALALETDKALSEVHWKIYEVNMRLVRLANDQRISRRWSNQSLHNIDEAIAAAKAEFVSLQAEYKSLNQIWIDNGRWSRTFVVPSGHVHSSMDCHTCYPTTRYFWYVEFSGAEEAEIVENAGDRACTICYPTAPVDRPTTMYTPDEKQAKVDAEARAQAKIERDAAKKAKAATASGDPLGIPGIFGAGMELVRTEAAARQEWNRAEDLRAYPSTDRIDLIQEIIEKALAEKHGTSPEVMREELQKRYAKRSR
jgi:hypothetical protein